MNIFGVPERPNSFLSGLSVLAFENISNVKVSKAHASCTQKIKSVVEYRSYVIFV